MGGPIGTFMQEAAAYWALISNPNILFKLLSKTGLEPREGKAFKFGDNSTSFRCLLATNFEFKTPGMWAAVYPEETIK